MAEAKKIALVNLAALRSELGITQEEMAAEIAPMSRQTLATIENGEFKDSLFLRSAFDRLKSAFGPRFEVFDLVRTNVAENTFEIRYTRKLPEYNSAQFDHLAYDIMNLATLIRDAEHNNKDFLSSHQRYLEDLKRTLVAIYG